MKNTIIHNLNQLSDYIKEHFSTHGKGNDVRSERSETLLDRNSGIMDNFILGMTNQCDNISTE